MRFTGRGGLYVKQDEVECLIACPACGKDVKWLFSRQDTRLEVGLEGKCECSE